MLTLSRVFAIARTEFRFGFRRGGPVVIMALIGLVVGAGILILPISSLVANTQLNINNLTADQVAKLAANGLTVEQFKNLFTSFAADLTVMGASMAWPLMLLALVMLPPATAPSIPADRKYGVGELLRSTPITGFSYLAGKILGVVAVVCLIASMTLILFFIALEVVLLHFLQISIPAYLVYFYIKLTLSDGLPILVWGSAVGVLTGVALATRRGAILPGLIMGILSIPFWGLAFTPVKSYSTMDVAAYYLFFNYQSPAEAFMTKLTGQAMPAIPGMPGGGTAFVGIGQVLLMYGTVILGLLVLAILARLWLQWKENF